jgi:hypothetical protein
VLKEAVGYFPSRDADGEDPWEAFVDLPEERYGFGVASSGDAVFMMGGKHNGATQQSRPFVYQLTESEWQQVQVEMSEVGGQSVLVPLGLQIYTLTSGTSTDQTSLWKYQASYYTIYFPFVP